MTSPFWYASHLGFRFRHYDQFQVSSSKLWLPIAILYHNLLCPGTVLVLRSGTTTVRTVLYFEQYVRTVLYGTCTVMHVDQLKNQVVLYCTVQYYRYSAVQYWEQDCTINGTGTKTVLTTVHYYRMYITLPYRTVLYRTVSPSVTVVYHTVGNYCTVVSRHQ